MMIPVYAEIHGKRKQVYVETNDEARSVNNLRDLFCMLRGELPAREDRPTPQGTKVGKLERNRRRIS